MHDRLETLRKEIDGLDTELVRLFEKRLTLCEEIGQVKREAKLPICDEGRERAVMEHCLAQINAQRHVPYAERFTRTVVSLCREYQQQQGKGDA